MIGVASSKYFHDPFVCMAVIELLPTCVCCTAMHLLSYGLVLLLLLSNICQGSFSSDYTSLNDPQQTLTQGDDNWKAERRRKMRAALIRGRQISPFQAHSEEERFSPLSSFYDTLRKIL
ncbi:hypothetical protein Tcan_17396 [Toxocara canis]|uniref:Uncharacterized protein n=1 Tax=Toxocara canis TaxID=6265 RepID=A0A0B2W131_TOXCA|nr:hypothetical protein Tcan_17396 [Toxocara canis]